MQGGMLLWGGSAMELCERIDLWDQGLEFRV